MPPMPPMEPMEDPRNRQLSAKPIQDAEIYAMCKKAQGLLWVFEEISAELEKDPVDWNTKLTPEERAFFKNIIAFFAVSDEIVNETSLENILSRIQIYPWKFWEHIKLYIEDIHNFTYASFVEKYIVDSVERVEILEAVRYNPFIQKKIDWVHKWVGHENAFASVPRPILEGMVELYNHYVETHKEGDTPSAAVIEIGKMLEMERCSLATAVLINAIMEGVFFSGSFCAIFWLKKRGLMPGLCIGNELISRDEGMHSDGGVILYNKLEHKLAIELVAKIMGEAVEIECGFIESSLPQGMIGMNATLMKQYIRFVSDQLLLSINSPKLFNDPNPFPWMEMQSVGVRMTSFFERDPTAYRKFGVGNTSTEMSPAFDEQF